MRFSRLPLQSSVEALAASDEVHERCIGRNYLVEENVGPARLDDLEGYDSAATEVRQLVQTYFDGSIQGVARGHACSTFDQALNDMALLPATVEPNQKIVRLERIDRILARDPALTFARVSQAKAAGDASVLRSFVDLFAQYPGERPSFAAFKAEVEADLAQPDWLQRLIDRLGLYHHYPFDAAETYSFALMEYKASDVFALAGAQGVERPFALATVLECRDNPAFFPVPHGTAHGFTVDLRARNPHRPSVREILHIRFDYQAPHVARLAQWGGNGLPDIESSRDRHLATLRGETQRPDFGALP